jgi:hypothetical protein
MRWLPTTLQLERWGPLVIAFLAMAVWWACDGVIGDAIANDLLAALLSAAAISAGFMTTALSILLTITTTPTGKKLRKSGYLSDLFAYIRHAIYSCLGLAALSVISFFALKKGEPLPLIAAYPLIFFAALTAGSLARAAEVVLLIFLRVNDESDTE